VVALGWLYEADLSALQTAREHYSDFVGGVWSFFPLLGGLEIVGAALLLLLVGLFLRGQRVLAGGILAVFVLTGVLELAIKFYLPQVPVPQGTPQAEDYAPPVAVDHTYPYPSGHVIRSVIVFGALLLLSRNRFLRAGPLAVLGVSPRAGPTSGCTGARTRTL
jgi:hypothetical protein